MAKIRRKGERGGEVTGPSPEAEAPPATTVDEPKPASPPEDITKIDEPKPAPKAKARKASRY